MNAALLGILVVGGSTMLAVAGMFFVRQFVHLEKLQTHHEVGGYLLSVLGTLYAVVLGFIVVSASQSVDVARSNVEHEANSVADIFRLAEGLPARDRGLIQAACEEYARLTIEDEWPKMEESRVSTKCAKEVDNLWKAIRQYEPQKESEKAFYGQMLSALDEFGDCRRERLIASRGRISSILWAVLIVGGVSTTVFTYFFGLESVKAQALMTILVSVTLSLNVLLVAIYSTPFSGDFKVQPDAFRMDLDAFSRILDARKGGAGSEEPHVSY